MSSGGDDEAWAERRRKDYVFKKAAMEKDLAITQGEKWASVIEKLLVAWYDLDKRVKQLEEYRYDDQY